MRNILLMIIITIALIALVMLGLNLYTRHGQYVEVPNLEGLQVEEAAAIIKSAGLKYEVVDSLYDRVGTPGSILDQIPNAKSKVKEGRVLFLSVKAKSVQMLPIPDVSDISARQAEALLNAVGFSNIKREAIESEYRDLVFSVSAGGKTLKPGDKAPKNGTLTLSVGSGSLSSSTDSSLINTEDQQSAIDPSFTE